MKRRNPRLRRRALFLQVPPEAPSLAEGPRPLPALRKNREDSPLPLNRNPAGDGTIGASGTEGHPAPPSRGTVSSPEPNRNSHNGSILDKSPSACTPSGDSSRWDATASS
ncbi:MAG: hypothetical protein WCV62_03040 [Candidatus Peribacteraceae bacterium]